jgi:MerR family mercuric resistance operon transcriptional regulator
MAARSAGVNVETIRYYQRRGLLARPPSMGGIRRYPQSLVQRVAFIKRAQRLGFTLDEIAQLLALTQGSKCSQACELAERQMEVVTRKIAELQAMHRTLSRLVTGCQANRSDAPCPLPEGLAAQELSAAAAAR